MDRAIGLTDGPAPVQQFIKPTGNTTMGIIQPKYLFFFCWMFIIPATVAYIGGWDTTLDYLFFLKAFAIAIFSTVAYYLIEKQRKEKKR